MKKTLLCLTTLSLLCSCRVGPHHRVPAIEIEEEWDAAADPIVNASPVSLEELFDDPLLSRYLHLLEQNSPDLQIARTKVFQAYAQRNISAAKLLPFFDLNVNNSGAKPAGGILNSGDSTGGGSSVTGIPLLLKQKSFLVEFDALWEIDFFGKTRREVEGATALVGMEYASYDFTLLTLKSEFARIYFELRENQELLRIINEEASLLEREQRLLKGRFGAGIDAETTYLRTDTLLANLQAQIPPLQSSILKDIYQLSVLIGQTPRSLRAELEASAAPMPTITKTIPVGFPSELIRRRPDIRMAERQLAKAAADVGVAIAQLFPKLTLRGSYGYQDLSIGQASGDGKSWSYATGLLTPIFHAGALRANVSGSKWAHQEAFLNYENSVLKALEETETAIARFVESQKALSKKQAALQNQTRIFKHAKDIFLHGLTNEQALLNQEQELIERRKDVVSQQAVAATSLVALYKALGGGFCDQ